MADNKLWDKIGNIISTGARAYTRGVTGKEVPDFSKIGQGDRLKKPGSENSEVVELHTGGRVAKTGVFKLQKGELVIPARVVQRLDKKRKTARKSGRR
jgi:hypothetical protein